MKRKRHIRPTETVLAQALQLGIIPHRHFSDRESQIYGQAVGQCNAIALAFGDKPEGETVAAVAAKVYLSENRASWYTHLMVEAGAIVKVSHGRYRVSYTIPDSPRRVTPIKWDRDPVAAESQIWPALELGLLPRLPRPHYPVVKVAVREAAAIYDHIRQYPGCTRREIMEATKCAAYILAASTYAYLHLGLIEELDHPRPLDVIGQMPILYRVKEPHCHDTQSPNHPRQRPPVPPTSRGHILH